MTTPTASPTPTPGPTRRREPFDRRMIWLSALVLFGSLVVGIVLMAIFADPGSDPQPTTTESGSPHIIDRPNSGTKPTNPGDRGGWEQLALLGGMIVVIGGIAYVVFKGGASAKANRAQWKAAGESGQDGALSS